MEDKKIKNKTKQRIEELEDEIEGSEGNLNGFFWIALWIPLHLILIDLGMEITHSPVFKLWEHSAYGFALVILILYVHDTLKIKKLTRELNEIQNK